MYSKKYAMFVMAILFIVCGLRDYSVGIDTASYVDKYTYNYNEYTSEFLFNATYSIAHIIGASAHVWLLFVSALLYIPYMIAIKKYSDVPMLSVFLFLASPVLFFFDSMNGIRQWIAGGLILLSFVYKDDNKYEKSILCFFSALGFHLSSLVALPFMFMSKKTIPYKLVLVSILLVSVLSLTLSHFNLSSIFEQYTMLLDGMNLDDESKFAKYARYGDMENTTNWKYYLVNIIPLNIICLVSYPFVKQQQHHLTDNNDSGGFLYNSLFIATILMNICAISIMYGQRIMFAIITLQLILLPKQYKSGTLVQKKTIKCLVLYMSIWFIYYIISINGSRIGSTVPYSFFFTL